jgi:hypothetical protein
MTSIATFCIFLKNFPKQIDQDEIIEVLDQDKAPEWHVAMVNAKIDIFEMTYKESVSYLESSKNLEKIRHTNNPGLATIPVNN